jgi:hypothetical protein
MNTYPQTVISNLSSVTGQTEVDLYPGRMLRIDDGEGLELRVRTGTVWVTQDRDPRDICLHPGQRFVLDRRGPALVTGCGDAALVVRAPRRNNGATVAGASLERLVGRGRQSFEAVSPAPIWQAQ